jgi:IPT/TIG domain
VNRRPLGALACAALTAGALAVDLAPHAALAATCSPPHVQTVTDALGHGGDVVTVSGSGFTCGGQGDGTWVSVGGAGQRLTALGDTALQFQASGAAGSVVVTVSHPVLIGSQSQGSNTDRLFLVAPVVNGATATPGPGGGFTVSGSGFAMGGFLRGLSASACGQPLAVGSTSDTTVALTAPGGYCNGGVTLGVTGYATTAKSPSQLTNAVQVGAGGLDVQPSIGGLSAGAAAPGQVVSLSGAGFGSGGSATLNGAAVPSSWSDTGIGLTVQPQSTSGPVVFTRADGRQIQAGGLTVDARIDGSSPPRAQAGDTVTIDGAGFGPDAGSVSLGSTGLPVTRWSPTQVAVTVPGGATTGDLTVRPQGNAPSTLPNGIIVLHVDGVSPGSGSPGATVGITGSGFGQQRGSVTIAGVPASVTIWGDSTIAVVVPGIGRLSAGGGDAQVVVNVPGAASPLTATFHVNPGPPSTPGATPGQTPGSTPGSATSTASPGGGWSFISPSAGGPMVQPDGSVDFHRAPRLPGPVDLVLSSSRAAADPGQDVPFTVTLTAFGKPVVGAPVDLLLVVVPGGDASVSPAKGVTDSAGRVSGVLHLSRRAGDHIILARSGQYSDEIKITGLGLARTGGAASTDGGLGGVAGGGGQRMVIVGALLACLVLFLSGFGINMVTAESSEPVAAAGRRRGRLRGLAILAANAGSAVQFGLAMAVCGVGQLVAAARRR